MADYLPTPNGWPNNLRILKCTIGTAADGASEIVPLQGKAIVGLIMPASWTAAAIQYYGSINGNARELKALKDGSTSVYLQTLVAAGDWIVFPLADALFAPYVQLVSVTATTVTPVVQGADREILLLVRNYLD